MNLKPLILINLLINLLIIVFSASTNIAADNNYEEFIVSVNLNLEDKNIYINILKGVNNNIFIKQDDIAVLNLKDEYIINKAKLINNINYIDLESIGGITCDFNVLNLSLHINILPRLLKQTIISAKDSKKALLNFDPIKNGIYTNYDFSISHSLQKKHFTPNIYFFNEFNYFNSLGVFSNSLLYKKPFSKYSLNNTKYSAIDKFYRIETNYTIELPGKVTYFKLGDSITKPAYWSGNTRFAGIQYATDFTIRPDLITTPLFDFSYINQVPSGIEVYNNSRKLFNSDVSAGPYKIEGLPLLTGKGEVLIKLKNLNGEIQTINIPYYIAPNLLGKGIRNFSFESGLQRNNHFNNQYGFRKHQYKNYLFNSDYMYGITNYWTTGGHLEILNNKGSIGITNNFQIFDFGIGTINIASNIYKFNQSQRLLIGYSYFGKKINFNANISKNGKNYANIYQSSFDKIWKESNKVNYQFSLSSNHDSGSYSLSFLSQPLIPYNNFYYPLNIRTKAERNNIISCSYSNNISKNNYFMVTLNKQLNKKKDFLANINYTIIGDNTNYTLSNSLRHKHAQNELIISSPIKQMIGKSYEARITRGPYKENKLALNYMQSTSIGQINLETSHYNKSHNHLKKKISHNNIKTGIKGSIAFFDNDIFLSRTINNSFALIKTNGIDNLMILNNNISSGYTNNKGKLLIPELYAYHSNKITLDHKHIPFNLSVKNTEQNIITRRKTGNILVFNAKYEKPAQLQLIDINNNYLPVNRQVLIDGISSEHLLGYNGKLYIPNIYGLKILQGSVNEDGQICSFTVPIIDNYKEHILNLGHIYCK